MSTAHTEEELEGVKWPETQADAEADLDGLIFGELSIMKPRLLMWRNTSDTPDEDAIYIALDHIDIVSVHNTLAITIGVFGNKYYSEDLDTIDRFWDQWDVV